MHDRQGSSYAPPYSASLSVPHSRPEYGADYQIQTLLRQIRKELRTLRALRQEKHADIHPLEDIQQHLRELRDIIKFWVAEEQQRTKAGVEAARE
jgi:hypothetical protein